MLHPQTLTANLKGIITDIRVNERNRKLLFAAGNASYLYRNNFSIYSKFFNFTIRIY